MISINTKGLSVDQILSLPSKYKIEFHLELFMENLNEKYFEKLQGLNILIADGGWSDFSYTEDMFEFLYAHSIIKQMRLIERLNAPAIRLFFTPKCFNQIMKQGVDNIVLNINTLTKKYPSIKFLFETHKGIGVEIDHVVRIMEETSSNVGIVFDPINLIVEGKDISEYMNRILPWIRHVHLKGWDNEKLCTFGEGVDISHHILKLIDVNSFGIEYEIENNKIENLLKGCKNLENLLETI